MRFDMEPDNRSLTKRTIDDTITEIALTGLILVGFNKVVSIFDNLGALGGIVFLIYLIAVIRKNYLENKYN